MVTSDNLTLQNVCSQSANIFQIKMNHKRLKTNWNYPESDRRQIKKKKKTFFISNEASSTNDLTGHQSFCEHFEHFASKNDFILG